MKRLGLDYPELAKINPRIIYGAISGYGQTGPAAGRPAYAPVIHASTGYDMAHLFYQQGRERPDNCGIFVADYASGAYALGGILAALHQRHVTGKGQMVDVSMFETLVGMLLGEVNRAQFDFEMPSRPMYGPVEAKDGYVMLATASETHLPGHGDGGRPARLADRSALREVRRPAHELGQVRRRVRGLVEDAHGQGMRRRAGEARRALLALSHRHRGAEGPAGRASRLALHHRGQRRVPTSRRRRPSASPARRCRAGPRSPTSASTPRACWPRPA